MSNFGQIRSIVNGPATPEAWQRLWTAMLETPEHERERVVSYVDSSVRSWPDTLRVIGKSWKNASDANRTTMSFALRACRTFELTNSSDTLDWAFESFEGTPPMTFVTHLNVSATRERFTNIARVVADSGMTGLESVDLSRSRLSRYVGEDEQVRAMGAMLGSLARLRHIDLSRIRWLNAARTKTLLGPCAPRLRSLSLAGSAISLDELEAIEAPELRALDISHNRVWLSPGELDLVAWLGRFEHLESLDISHNDTLPSDVPRLLGALGPRLRTLGLRRLKKAVGADDAKAISAKALPLLHRLVVDEDMLAAGIFMPALRDLVVSDVGREAPSAKALERLRRLERLEIQGSIDHSGVERLLEHVRSTGLHTLVVSKASLGAQTLEVLGSNPAFETVERLVLRDVTFPRPVELERLLEPDVLPSLAHLELDGAVTHHGEATRLVGSRRIEKLSSLSLGRFCVPYSLVEALFSNPSLPRLNRLVLGSTDGFDPKSVELMITPKYEPLHWTPIRRVIDQRNIREYRRRAAEASTD